MTVYQCSICGGIHRSDEPACAQTILIGGADVEGQRQATEEEAAASADPAADQGRPVVHVRPPHRREPEGVREEEAHPESPRTSDCASRGAS